MGINETNLVIDDLVQQKNNGIFVDSLTIAKYTVNEHASVLKITRKNIYDLEDFGRVRFEIEPFQTNGGIQKRKVAYLNENQSMFLMTLLNNTKQIKSFKLNLIKAFSIMKERLNNQNYQIPTHLSQALYLAAKQAEQIEQQQEQLRLDAPKVEFYEMAIKSNYLLSISETSKVIDKKNLGRDKLFKFLRIRKVLQKNNIPYQEYIDRGYFKVCESIFNRGSKAGIGLTTKVTQKGVEWINKQVNEWYEILKDRVQESK